jgi:hypothetical protein
VSVFRQVKHLALETRNRIERAGYAPGSGPRLAFKSFGISGAPNVYLLFTAFLLLLQEKKVTLDLSLHEGFGQGSFDA